eukprot:s4607_g3.t1
MQLRRMQSMLHALRAGKQTWDAIIYRTELWQAIRKARGFEGGFSKWWLTRSIQCQGSPVEIPQFVPSLCLMTRLFVDYYRQFEAWHASQRQELLQLSLQENQNKIFAMVKPTGKAPLQHLKHRREVQILGVSDDGSQLHVSEEHSLDDTYVCDIEGQQVEVISTDGPVWTLKQPVQAADPEVIEEHHEDITLGQWKEINQRYGKNAARGSDGYARRDLQWMPERLQEQLVSQLNDWERQGQFPKALCTGFVHPLPKREISVQVGDFRPVIIYSMIYRSWSSLRARQILRLLSNLAGHHQFGFLQQKENSEIWMVLQAWIEESILSQSSLVGYVSDIEKAFECLPREPLLWLGRRMGISKRVLGLWDHFLNRMTRRFMLSNQVGPALASNSGVPEGCGMSCTAMAITNVVFHKYMDVYSRVTSLSFVDNLELLSRSTNALHDGVMVMRSWADMWALRLDEAKSYTWASNAAARVQCKMIGPVKMHARDLGAPMTYGSKHSVADQLARIQSLKPLWALLKRITGSLWIKQKVLYQAFWPRAYYGSAICCMSWTHTKQLRTEAMRALKFSRGGANPGMRLGVLCPPQTDPGYYHFWQVLLTFKRIAQKQPGFTQLWVSFMRQYRGDASYGPFGKLLEVCGQVGWQVQPPYILDHDGVSVNLLTYDTKKLEDMAIDAWRQSIAAAFAQRKDAKDLKGLDWRIMDKVHKKMAAFRREAIHVLQDGTFIEGKIHCRYDFSKDGRCKKCGKEDSMKHRCLECPATQHVREKYPNLMSCWERLPTTFALRLLPPRNSFQAKYKLALHRTEMKSIGLRKLNDRDQLDLFTDGSCLDSTLPWGSAGAWAVVSATHDKVVARGTVGGPLQTSDHAELLAIHEALRYAVLNSGSTTIWSDSAYATMGVARLLNCIQDVPQDVHSELWDKIQGLLHGQGERIYIQHISAHRRADRLTMDVDSWTAYWNDRVDHEALQAHQLRDPDVEMLRQLMLQEHHEHLRIFQELAAFHFDISECYFAKNTNEVDEYVYDQGEGEEDGLFGHRLCLQHVPWQGELPELQQGDLGMFKMIRKFGMLFTRDMMNWLRGVASVEHVVAYKMSFIEIAIHIGMGQVSTKIPVPDPQKKLHWTDAETLPAAMVSKPTVAAILKLIQNFFQSLADSFDFEIPKCDSLDLSTFGVFPPQRGIEMLVGCNTVKMIGSQLTSFCNKRPIRSAGDLTRPIR